MANISDKGLCDHYITIQMSDSYELIFSSGAESQWPEDSDENVSRRAIEKVKAKGFPVTKERTSKNGGKSTGFEGPIFSILVNDITYISVSAIAAITFIKGIRPIILEWLKGRAGRKIVIRTDQLEVTIRESEDIDKILLTLGDIYMGSQYTTNNSQVGALGDHSQAKDFTQQQVASQATEPIDLQALTSELTQMRGAASATAVEPEDHAAVGSIAAAEAAAKKGDEAGTLKYLKNAGEFALKVAQDISAKLAVEIIKKQIGL